MNVSWYNPAMKFTQNKRLIAIEVAVCLIVILVIIIIAVRGQSATDTTEDTNITPTVTLTDIDSGQEEEESQPTPTNVEQDTDPTATPTNPDGSPQNTNNSNSQPTPTTAPGQTTQPSAQTNTYEGQNYDVSLNYPVNWTATSSFVGPNQSVESLRVYPDENISFNVSFYPAGSFVSVRQDYTKVNEKTITINGSSVTSARYEGYYDPDDGDERPDDLIVITVDDGSFVADIQSYFNPGSYSNGWDIINNIAKSLQY